MSAGTWTGESATARTARTRTNESVAYTILRALGSLKITVTMFGAGILLLLFGTLAQDQQNLAEVKRLYFNAWLAIIPVDVLFPVPIFGFKKEVPGLFPFPGGATIGLILLINLIAAKATRFSVSAKGAKLGLGIFVSLIGAGIITAVIIGGHAANGLQGKPPISYDALWSVLRGGFALGTIVLMGYILQVRNIPRLAKILSWASVAILLSLSLWMIFGGSSARLNAPGMRIVWQLLQAGIASAVCLVGLAMIFGKRGGNVLIHAGIGLMMVGQFVFGDRQVEQRLSLAEGETTSLVFLQDELELAIIDPSDSKVDFVWAIPEARLRRAIRNKETIVSDELPLKLKIVAWMPNSVLDEVTPKTSNPATMGLLGEKHVARLVPSSGGAMSQVNVASAYVQVYSKNGKEALGTVLLTQHKNDQAQLFVGVSSDENERVTVDGKEYELGLRFRRQYKPYQVTLKDVARVDYSGTETPRDYSSTIVIEDKENGRTQEGRTWMNNPIRYQGETFYQSSYNRAMANDGTLIESTGLQVVENAGWVIPYVTCMMVLVGMLAHFGSTFWTFANRHQRGAIPTASKLEQVEEASVQSAKSVTAVATTSQKTPWWPAVAGVSLVALTAAYYARPAKTSPAQVNWTAVSQLPAQHEGRIKPLDTVALNVLQVISEPVFDSVTYVRDENKTKWPAVAWFMGVLAEQEWTAKAPVFRIYAKEVQDFFGLEPSSDSKYSYEQLRPKMSEFRAELKKLEGKKPEQFDDVERKYVKLHQKLNLYHLLTVAYQIPHLPDPSNIANGRQSLDAFENDVKAVRKFMNDIEGDGPPALLPPVGEGNMDDPETQRWQAYAPMIFDAYRESLITRGGIKPNPAILAFTDVLDALRSEKPAEINKSIDKYAALMKDTPQAAERMSKAKTEAWFNKFAPTAQAVTLYLFAIALGFATFMTGSIALRRGTFWLLAAIFVIHSVAIISRIYISGRPPVINLYSSAVFIGWATALLGLILELIYPIGVCNLAVGIIGAVTLSIAKSLENNDTMHVLQAVLDTQFWLSTHVVTVTYGYAATYLAGILGIMALVHLMTVKFKRNSLLSSVDKNFQDIIYRMTYGVVCFGLFLSFIGTVLGGLWADDSWGRFWGWDPKENGALMIVLWNAIVLHARWDKQVGQRGFALLAVVGNIITTWSWFGVNQLGVGLHSYGNNSSVLMTLAATVLAHLAFIGFAFLMTRPQAGGGGGSGDTKSDAPLATEA